MRIGIFGGTFDPVHKAHLMLAENAREQLRLDETFLVPTRPWQKTARASDDDRKIMLEMALKPYKGLKLDSRELDRAGASYSIDTLYSFRKQFGSEAQLFFLMGTDQWANLKTWIQWEHFPDLVNLVLFKRGGVSSLSPYGDRYPILTNELAFNCTEPHGCILFLETDLPDYSSSQIRKQLYEVSTRKKRIDALPTAVYDYIIKKGLYLPREGSIYI